MDDLALMVADAGCDRPSVPCSASMSFDAAQALLVGCARPLGTQTMKLAEAGGHVLAAPVHAKIDAPRYDAAAMDGFAVAADDLVAGVTRFRVVGSSYPAAPHRHPIGPGEAVRIMTGAPMPAGSDRVLMREQVLSSGDTILFEGGPGRAHVRSRGSDFAVGRCLLPAGRLLDGRALAVAAAGDAAAVEVWRRPRVAIVASGDELAAPGSAAGSPLAIPDSLGESLAFMADAWGGVVAGAARIADDPVAIREAAASALGDADLVVMIGGASRGDRDFAKTALVPLGLERVFADVTIKPGKPVWYGRIGSRHVLGLPGNPVAAFTIARLFLMPLLAGLGGGSPRLAWTKAPLAARVPETGDRETFLCASETGDGVRVIEGQTASAQALLADADTLVRFAPRRPACEAGAFVDTLRF
ncbi:molybdopterin molybdotransferase MoeA [Sphingosinicella sp. BN140058]|uniref:molybdopterin molybdotransferase MoeA n=1 Tax=Sphingosinicella sp. BN140058 TaxID=1892855 RepID=UPI001012D426|nr:molybdopterin molybdotransferase MoeA [Sphingosinicella sp. BN140058]QAY77510.1 molybdopterin molybdenumtransferase MoeA [Sphingosinicella sp. BN140058]